MLPPLLFCVDFGSTFTKVALVDTGTATVLGTAQHRTTLDADVLDGYRAARAEILALHPEADDAPTAACSSAGGGLRIAVVGNEDLVTAEAGRRVALSSGGTVVEVLAGGLDADGLERLVAARPDVVLLVGGTDGGNSEQLLHDAEVLARAAWPGPVVVAGDIQAQAFVAALLDGSGTPYVVTDNVVPRIGVLVPGGARAAVREVFLSHVIGGKELSQWPAFAAMVLGPTPEVFLRGVEALADALGSSVPGSGVVVVDVGGATTDVHSVVVLDPETGELAREVVAEAAVTRTVEGDLGMRWSAVGTAATQRDPAIIAGAKRRAADPAYLVDPTDEAEADIETALAAAAVGTALRRHAGRARVVLADDGRVVERSGKDLRAVNLLVGSGGVLRSMAAERAASVLGRGTGVDPDGWQLPEAPRVLVDHDGVLGVSGLLLAYGDRIGAEAHAAEVARALICTSVIGTQTEGTT